MKKASKEASKFKSSSISSCTEHDTYKPIYNTVHTYQKHNIHNLTNHLHNTKAKTRDNLYTTDAVHISSTQAVSGAVTSGGK